MANRISFLGLTLHPIVKRSLPLLNTLASQHRRTLLKIVNEHLMNNDVKVALSAAQLDLSPADKDIVFAGTVKILKLASQQKVSIQNFKDDLMELKVDQTAIEDLATVYSKCSFPSPNSGLPKMTSLKYRIDVEIATNNMSRLMQPHFNMATDDGTLRHFDVSVKQFHQMRFAVAKALKELDDVAQLQVMKTNRSLKKLK